MTSRYRTRAGFAAALAAASLAAAGPAGADPNPAQRVQSNARPELRALAQEQYYKSHKPVIPAPGHDFRTIDAREAANVPGGAVTRVTTPVTAEPADSSGFEWDDAAIGAGTALGLALAFAGGAAAVTRRHRGTTGRAATS
jgi:hypothetical protein